MDYNSFDFIHIMESFGGRIHPDQIDYMEETIGRVTINQMRTDAGIDPVPGGDVVYCDYLRQMMGYQLPTIH